MFFKAQALLTPFLFVTALFGSLVQSVLAQQPADLVGRAFDIDTRVALYREEHRFAQSNSNERMQTLYITTDEEVIGERVVEFEDGRVQNYSLSQPQIDFAESVARSEQGLDIKANKYGTIIDEFVNYPNARDIIIDAGFNKLIERNWDKLIAGDKIKFPFASTGRVDVVNLQLKRVAKDDEILAADNRVRFEMNIANPLLRLLLAPVSIEYYADIKQVARYRGISNIKGADKQNLQVVIEFARMSEPESAVVATAPIKSKITVLAN
ncbi:MAG: hypothetical protein AAF197_03375 [Pseudomonadota bacterium]